MALQESERIIIPGEDGEEHLFDVLFKFDIDATGKTYIVVIPADIAEEDLEEVEVFAFRYEENVEKLENEDDFNLFPIETDEEWDMVEEMIDILDQQAEEEE